jgi:Mn2+/Fe2+ NRAMP family transporter
MGPGLMYAAAAVGVSHLVQSTRAGADFGYGLIWAIIIANIVKYPFFKIGTTYPTIAKESLLDGYKRLGNYALIMTTIINFLTLFFVQAAITIVTSGLLSSILGLEINLVLLSCIILFVCCLILYAGKFNVLDNLIKTIMIILCLTTIVSLLISSKQIETFTSYQSFDFSNDTHLFFLIALIGWMPAPMDVPIWQSLWTVQKNKSQARSFKESVLDFNIGYIGTIFLAVGFLLLGAWVMHNSGENFSSNAVVFSKQLLALYTQNLGSWSYPIIAIACFSTMFSTCFACLDAFSKMSSKSIELIFNPSNRLFTGTRAFLVYISGGSVLVLIFFLKDMRSLVDFVTTLSFVIAPIYCYFNMRLMKLDHIEEKFRPRALHSLINYLFIFIMLGFSLYFIYLSFLK